MLETGNSALMSVFDGLDHGDGLVPGLVDAAGAVRKPVGH